MVEKEGYVIENIYQGGYSSLAPDYGSLFTGYRADAGTLGLSTDPRTANIIKEVSDKIAPGEKVIELSLIQPDIFEVAIPHAKEINRISKLTGVDITVHGPLIDASGVTQQGFDESQRELAERKIMHYIEKSHEINPDGNIPVTFHTANLLRGAVYSKKDGVEKTELMPIMNQATGEITAVKPVVIYRPYSKGGEVKKEEYDVNKALDERNKTEWSDSLDRVEFNRESAERIMQEVAPAFVTRYIQYSLGQINKNSVSSEEMQQFKKISSAQVYLNEAERTANALFDRAYKYGSEEQKHILKKIAKNFGEMVGIKDGEKRDPQRIFNPRIQSDALFQLRSDLEKVPPELWKSAEKYALEKSHETFGNVAWQSYKKFKDKAPIISIENPPAGFGLSRAEDVKNMVVGSREQFVKNAMQEGMGKKEAEREAEKIIGVTWDVGHINQLRQFGFTGKDIVKEAEKVAPLVKHIHLSDNFGMENTELPMGMGNVDLKEVMEKLGKKGEKAKKIVEAAHWWIHQRTSPMGMTFEALGSPMYSTNEAPYWNQALGLQQGYFGGLEGNWLPQGHYETFGGGFSNLPTDLGGQRAGGRSRMGGTPME